MRRLDEGQRTRATAWSAIDAYELPTTLRRSAAIPLRPPPPLRASLPSAAPFRGPLPSLASILEPNPWPPSPPTAHVGELRWLLRSVLLLFVIAGELVLADPTRVLHRPRDAGDAWSMVTTAAHASAIHALGH